MPHPTELLVEMARCLLARLGTDFRAIPTEARDWRPAPHSNTVNIILRHLRIEAEWHLMCLEQGLPMPTIGIPPDVAAIESVPIDFDLNLRVLTEASTRFYALLEGCSLEHIQSRTAAAYGDASSAVPAHFLAYHQLLHVSAHLGQAHTLHNLYRKARGEPDLVPNNPSYPAKANGRGC
jgi:hypothetical protein